MLNEFLNEFGSNDEDTPLISIGMSVYNAAETIRMSMLSILGQSYRNWELIVIDDGSTDASVKIIKEYNDPRIKLVVDGVNKGLAYRLNQAISLSGGMYFARMDADDIAYPDRLAKQLVFIKNNPQYDLISSKVLVFNDNYECVGGFSYGETHEEICAKPWSGFAMPHPTWFGKMEWFRNNLYNVNSKKSEDQELLLRTYTESKFYSVNEILLGYRQDQLTVKKETLTRLSKLNDYSFYFFKKGDYFMAIYSASLQIAKWVYSILSILSPVTYKLLSHRAVRLPDSDCIEWKKIYAALSKIDK